MNRQGEHKACSIITQNENFSRKRADSQKSSDGRTKSKNNSGIDLERKTSHSEAGHKKTTKCPPKKGQLTLLALTLPISQRAFKLILRKSLSIDL